MIQRSRDVETGERARIENLLAFVETSTNRGVTDIQATACNNKMSRDGRAQDHAPGLVGSVGPNPHMNLSLITNQTH